MNNLKHFKNSILKIFRNFIDEIKNRCSDKSNISTSKIVSSETIQIPEIKEKKKKRKDVIVKENIKPSYSVKKVNKKESKKSVITKKVKTDTNKIQSKNNAVNKIEDESVFMGNILNDLGSEPRNKDDFIVLEKKPEIEYEGIFNLIKINETAWIKIKNNIQFKRKIKKVITLIEHFYKYKYKPTKQIKRKLGPGKWKFNFSKSLRMPFSIEEKNDKLILILWELLDHDQGEKIHQIDYNPNKEELVDIFNKEKYVFEKVDHNNANDYSPLFRSWRIEDSDRLNDLKSDLQWKLYEEQTMLLNSQGPILLKGGAGSGKTTIAIYRLLEFTEGLNSNKNLYITYTPELRDEAKKIYYSLYSKENKDNTKFITIEELCKNIIKKDNYKDVDKVDYSVFKDLRFLKQFANNIPPEIIWEEIRGVIKGAFILSESKNLNRGHLSKKEYRDEIPKKQSLFEKNERNKIYQIFEKYETWKNKNKKWDELDLSIEAFKNLKNFNSMYNQVVADEVQDFTTFELKILTYICSNPYGLFLTGDSQQMIHPTRFEWRRITTFIYNYLTEKRKYSIPNIDIKEIKKNYRSSGEIVKLHNRLCGWRNQEFGENNTELEPVNNNGENNSFIDNTSFFGTGTDPDDSFTANLAVVIASEECRVLAEKYFPRRIIYTIYESKGLEWKYVYLFNFFDDETIDFKKTMSDKNNHRKILIANLLNVAITRAQKNLIIIDKTFPDYFQPMNYSTFDTTETTPNSLDLYNRIWKEKSEDIDYINLAKELENKGKLEHAAENYLAGKSSIDAHRCYGLFYERKSEYLDAAQHYDDAQMLSESVRCYEKINEYGQAFNRIINHHTDGKIEIVNDFVDDYLTDKKKLSKLNNMGLMISKAINRDLDINIDVLFEYSLERSRLLDFEINQSIGSAKIYKFETIASKFNELSKGV